MYLNREDAYKARITNPRQRGLRRGKRVIGYYCDKIILPWGNGTDYKSAPAGGQQGDVEFQQHVAATKGSPDSSGKLRTLNFDLEILFDFTSDF